MKINNHQELLLAYIEAKKAVIWEFSGDIYQDLLMLKREMLEYAESQSLYIEPSIFADSIQTESDD
jgi:hypothetical protein